MDMFQQRQLGLGWADDEDFLCTLQGLYDGVVIVLVFRCASATQSSLAAVQLAVGKRGVDDRLFDVVWADVHDMGFRVVDPDQSMVMRQSGLLRKRDGWQ